MDILLYGFGGVEIMRTPDHDAPPPIDEPPPDREEKS
jgi:hypothetical protein